MKTKLLRKVRRDFSIVEYPLKNEASLLYKGERIYTTLNRYYKEYLIDYMIILLRDKYKNLGFANRGKKTWYNKQSMKNKRFVPLHYYYHEYLLQIIMEKYNSPTKLKTL